MLPRHLRLNQPRDFHRVRRQGQRWHEAALTLYTLRGTQPGSRIGFVVGRQIGTAAVRNRVKRRLRSSAQRWLALAAKGVDMVVVAHPQAARVSFQALDDALGAAMGRAGLLKPNPEEDAR